MKDKSTPETDRIAESLLYERADKRDYELRQHARRLERERDAERALADRLATALAFIDFRLAFIKDTANISSDNINSMRSMVFSNLEAWKESRDEP
jgi:transposase